MSSAEEEAETKPKRQKTDSAQGANGGGLKAEIAKLMKEKKEAVKSEDYAEAIRLKSEIEKLTASLPAATAKKASGGGGKRALSPTRAAEEKSPKKAAKSAKPPSLPPPRPPVAELTCDAFFDDARPEILNPHDLTSCEREAFRAVHTRNVAFLAEKLVESVPLCLQRDVVSRLTPLHEAILKADGQALGVMVKALRKSGWQPDAGLRKSTLEEQSTGEMSVLTLGFATGKVGAARGGREMNNALMDPSEGPEKLDTVIARSPLTEDHIKLLAQYNMLTSMPRMRRGKLLRSRCFGAEAYSPYVSIDACVEPAVMHGNLPVLQALLTLIDNSYGVTETHRAAVGTGELSDKLQSRSILATMRVGGMLSPIHFAAINPDATKLEAMLKREPSALSHASPSGLLPIHLAATCQSPAPLKLLLSEWQANRKVLGPKKKTPLHFAAAAGRAPNIRLLMGASGGPAVSANFPKEIRALLSRQSGSAVKIGNDGVAVLSQLLTDLLQRIAADARQRSGESKTPSSAELQAATVSVLKGAKVSRDITETAQKLMDGALKPVDMTSASAALHRQLSDLSEDGLRQMFDKIDQNGDGHLDRPEVKAIFDTCGIKLGKNALPKLFKSMDSDSSGDVSFEEFSAWMEAGSLFAKSLRRSLMASTGAMEHAEVVEAEAAEDRLKDSSSLVFNVHPLIESLGLVGAHHDADQKASVDYASALIECVCTKVLEVSANAARSQKKTTVNPEHLLTSVNTNEDLKGLYQQDTVVMNSSLLPMKDKDGYAALHYAAQAGHLDSVEALVACTADVNLTGPDQKTALALAAERGHTGTVKALIAAGAKLEHGDKRKRTPLLLAVRAGRTIAASVLLHHGANPDAADDSGNTIAHYAAAFGWDECVELLHKAGANLSIANQMKLAPVTAALQKGHRGVFRRMLELGIDVNFRDADGNTLLLSALTSLNRVTFDEVQFMLSKGADPAFASAQGTTVLHKVASAGLGQKPEHTAYAQHPFEQERLERLRGWSERPKPPPKSPGEATEDDDEQEDEEDEAESGDDSNDGEPKPKREKIVTGITREETGSAPTENLSENVYERGFHQLTAMEREALFRLGWDEQSWQRGDNPTLTWPSLDAQKRQAAITLGLNEQTWWLMPVRVVENVRGDDGILPMQDGWALGHNPHVVGEVRVAFRDKAVQHVHISRLLLEGEDAEGKFEHISVAIARLLLEKRAAPDGRNSNGTTPLMLALSTRKTDLAMLLLEHGANPNATEDVQTTPPGQPAPQPMTPLLALSVAPGVQTLSFGTWSACAALNKLIAKSANVLGTLSRDLRDPLVAFVQASDFQSGQALLDAGAGFGIDKSLRNVLHHTFAKVFFEAGAAKFAERLLSHKMGPVLLMEYSASLPHVTPLHDLTHAFAQIPGQYIPRMSTQQFHDLALAKVPILLNMIKAMPSSVDLSKWSQPASEQNAPQPQSPLSLICLAFQMSEHAPEMCKEAAELLCKRGVDPNGNAGCPPVLHSLFEQLVDPANSPLVRMLLPLTNLQLTVRNGETLLMVLLKKCWECRSGQPLNAQVRASVQLLLNARSDPNQPGSGLVRPLHLAASYRDEELVGAFIASKADPKLRDAESRTPLHYAVMFAPTGSNANFDTEELLLAAGADIAAQDSSKRCALHYAFLKGDEAFNFTYKDEGPSHVQNRWIQKAEDGTLSWLPKASQLLGNRIDPIETVASLCAVTGVDANAKDKEGMAPLHLAALRGSSISALKLVKAGANLEDEFFSNTPLGLAMHMRPETAVLLMQRGASTTATCLLFSGAAQPQQMSHFGMFGVPQHFGMFGAPQQPVQKAKTKQEAETLFSLAMRRLSDLQQSDPQAASAYLGAAVTALDCGFPRSDALNDSISSAQYVMLSTLISKVGDDVLRTHRFGDDQSILHRLAAAKPPADQQTRETMVKVARKLLNRAVPLAPDGNGTTPLHFAAENNFAPLLQLFLDHLGDRARDLVIAEDRAGITALGRAFRSSTFPLEVAAMLLARGASASRAIIDDQKKLTVLMKCIASAWPALGLNTWPEVLFKSTSPDVTMQDAKGRSCLMYAARDGRPELLLLILKSATQTGKTSELFQLKDARGRNALMHAIHANKVSFADELLCAISELSEASLQEQLGAQAQDGSTPLTMAVRSSDPVGIVCVLLRWMKPELVEQIQSKVDGSGQTALAQAVLRNNLPVVQALLAGRPLKPISTATSPPAGRMAGDMVKARITYQGSMEGAPSFGIEWLASTPNFETEMLTVSSRPLHSIVTITMPPGTGPGVRFDVEWDATIGGPGSPATAGGFDGEGPVRTPDGVIRKQDGNQRSLLHCCVAPLPFGSFENAKMLACLLKAGVPADLKDASGQTAADIAARQRSGRMLKVLKDAGATDLVCAAQAPCPSDFPPAVDLDADATAALSTAEAAAEEAHRRVVGGPPPTPIDKGFKAPSEKSRVVVANGPDGKPLDLAMTKVDVAQGPYGQNVFYRMQVLHEQNQDNYFLFTRWGRTGILGQFQTTPFETLEKARAEFCKIFKSKSANEWAERADFVKKPLKYQLHEIKYSLSVQPADALQMKRWKRLPAKSTPASLQRLLTVCSETGLLAQALQSANVDRPLGSLKRQPLDEALGLVHQIKGLVKQCDEERCKGTPSGGRLQELADEIAAASSRVYELVPTRNFKHENVAPIDTDQKVKQWINALLTADDIACAAKLLLGAQSKIASVSPLDYLSHALGIKITPLAPDSPELQLIEQYICRSAPKECMLYSGVNAQPLPEPVPGAPPPRSKWQAICDAECFSSKACDTLLPLVAPAGFVYSALASEDGALCIKKDYVHKHGTNTTKYPEVWIRPRSPEGSDVLVRLTEREVASKVAAIYRVEHRENKSSGDATLLFHGSGLANCLSMLSQGLKVQPPGVMQHGAAFGNGIYFANAFSKSRGYCSFHQGVGFMVLCDVTLGETLPSNGFDFNRAVRTAKLAVAKKKLGLAPETKPGDHPELKKINKELESQQFEDLEGTGYDSFHMRSGAAPNSARAVVHPDGCVVPCGELIDTNGLPCAGAYDELIVYNTSRVRFRYVIELRDFSEPGALRTAQKSNEGDEGMNVEDGEGGAGNDEEVEDDDEVDEDDDVGSGDEGSE